MFTGTHQNKIDAKGRVSIPALFRGVLKAMDGRETVKLVLRPSHTQRCLEAWPEPAFKALEAPLRTLDMFSEEYDDLASALFIDAYPVESDKEGRISVPESLAAQAGLTDSVVFMGFGERFLIWEPKEAEEFLRMRAERQKLRRIVAPASPRAAQPSGAGA
jgi:MraZ protein